MELEQIKKLSNQDLIQSLHSFFEQERRISRTILLHIKVIQDRRLFAARGFGSLFEMLIKEYKLSETSANQRLKALELLSVVPDAEECFLKGEVNLTTLALAQRQIKKEEKISGEKMSVDKKIEIVEQIKNKTQAQTEVQLMRLLPNTSSCLKTVERRISEDTVRLSLNIPDRIKEKMRRLQELWAHVNPSMDAVELIERSFDDTLSRIDPLLKKNKKSGSESRRSVAQVVTTPDAVLKMGRQTYFSVQTRQELWRRAGSCCEYVDELTNRRCSSKFGLEKDHVIPLAMGGSNDISNLRLLCKAHNSFMARQWFGDTKIDREIKKSNIQ